MISVRLDLDDCEFGAFTQALGPPMVAAAIRRAVRKTAQWARTHLLRRMGKEGLRRKILVGRVRLYDKAWRDPLADAGKAVKVWFGTDPIAADRIGRARALSRGFGVGRHRFPDAFTAPKFPGRLYRRTTRNRLPIQRVTVPIDQQAQNVMSEIEGEIPGKLRQFALHELRYQLGKDIGAH